MLVQIAVALAETWFLAELGTASLAGSALVVPFITMMHNMAAGGIGGGVASAMARALGAGRIDEARLLVPQAVLLAVGIGLSFTLFGWLALPTLYPLMVGGIELMEFSRRIGNQMAVLPFTVILDRSGKVQATQVGILKPEKLESIIKPLL